MSAAATNLFQLAPNDQSIFYLQYIFGSVGNLLPSTQTGGGSTINIVGTMFHYLNTLALTVGAVMVIYTVVVGLLKTAAEGEFLGKHWNSLWVPVRTVIGIASLFPTGSGYSGLQVVMMWIVLQGVGAGDTLWTTALNYTSVMGSPTATLQINALDLSTKMSQLYQTLTCHATSLEVNSPAKTTTGSSTFFCSDSNNAQSAFCQRALPPITLPFPTPLDSMPIGPGFGTCGSLNECDLANAQTQDQSATPPTTINTQLCNAQRAVLPGIMTTLLGIAQSYADHDREYVEFYRSSTFSGNQGSGPTTIPWILAACQSQGVTASQCCSFSSTNSQALKTALGSTTPPPSSGACSTQQALTASAFFDSNPPYPKGATSFSYANADKTAVTNLYLPFALQDVISLQNTSGSTSSSHASNDFISLAVSQYTQAISAAFSQYMTSSTQQLTGWESDAQSYGWIGAGSYYYKMANANNGMQAALPAWSVIVTDPTLTPNTMSAYRSNVQSADQLLQDIANQQNNNSSSFASVGSQSPQLSQMGDVVNSAGTGIFNAFKDMLSGNGTRGSGNGMATNPLASLHAFGEGLMITGDVLFAITVGIFSILLIAGGIDAFVMGTGVQNPLSTTSIGLIMLLAPPIYAFIGACYAFGGLVAVYTPLVPYIIFSMGGLGWMMATIEAMVAMPFVALGIMSPSGEHEIMGKSHHALGFIFNLFLRPSLMVFGMVASMLLACAGVTMINSTFAGVMSSIAGVGSNGQPDLIELIMFIAAYTTLVLTVLNKCFTLIFAVPEKVLTWIGMHAVQYGEEGALSGIRSAVEGAGSMAGQAMSGMATGAGGKAVAGEIAGRKALPAKNKEKGQTALTGDNNNASAAAGANNASSSSKGSNENPSGGGGGGDNSSSGGNV